MFCSKCGVKLDDSALFCSQCGSRITPPPAVSSTESEAATATPTTSSDSPDGGSALTDPFEEEDFLTEDFFADEFETEAKKPVLQLFDPADLSHRMRTLLNSKKVMYLLWGAVTLLFLGTVYLIYDTFSGGRDSDAPLLPAAQQEETATQPLSTMEAEAMALLTTGQELLLSGDYEGALAKYQEALTHNSDFDDTYLFGADIYLKQNDYNTAYQILQQGYAATNSRLISDRMDYIQRNTLPANVKSEDGQVNFYYQYDDAGNLVRQHTYSATYELTGWEEMTYDSTGNKTGSTISDKSGTVLSSSTYGYDSGGILALKTDYDGAGALTGSHKYLYNMAGQQIECADYDSTGTLTWTTRTEYDGSGNKLRDLGYDGSNTLTGYVETAYNESGNVSAMTRYDGAGTVLEWNETTYNELGREIGFTSYGADNSVVYRTETLYDEAGNKTERIRYNADGSVYSRTAFDLLGNKIKETLESSQSTFVYAYYYYGDVLCNPGVTPLSGQLHLTMPAGYRRTPNLAAGLSGFAPAESVFIVTGETADFYRVAEGWYFRKDPATASFVAY